MADTRDDFIISIRYALLKKGAKQKFSLFFLIILSISILTLDKLSLPFVNTARSVLNDFVYQVSYISSGPGKFIVYLNNQKKNHFNIVNKNKILKEEIEMLKNRRYDFLFLRTENKYLKEILELKEDNFLNNSIKANVIFDQESPYLKSVLINKGKKENIIIGMSVFSKNYLIGTVIESNFFTSRVLLITDLNSKIPVVLQDSNVNAILTGTGKKTFLSLEYLPDDFAPEPNKIIYTSGKDGFLASGIPVAKTYLNKKNELYIKPLADPHQALIVSVARKKLN